MRSTTARIQASVDVPRGGGVCEENPQRVFASTVGRTAKGTEEGVKRTGASTGVAGGLGVSVGSGAESTAQSQVLAGGATSTPPAGALCGAEQPVPEQQHAISSAPIVAHRTA